MPKKRGRTPRSISATVRDILRRREARLAKKTSKTKHSGWFHEQASGVEFYTPFCRTETRRHIAGPGDRMPTPKEVLDKLSELSSGPTSQTLATS